MYGKQINARTIKVITKTAKEPIFAHPPKIIQLEIRVTRLD